MKKLLLLLLLSLGITNPANAESDEQVNLTCTFYETFHWDDLTTTLLRPEEWSLVLNPEMLQYTYEGITDYYQEVANEIQFMKSLKYERKEYSLDRTTAVFKYTLSFLFDDEWKKAATFKGKCKKAENLF